MDVIVLHHVRLQIFESALWYQDQSEGLGGDFVDAVEAALVLIGKSPLIYPIVYRTARRAQLKRFPYGIFFIVQDNTAYICALSHLHGNPKLWQKFIPPVRRRLRP